MMKVKELMEYLGRFEDDDEIGLLVVNAKDRKRYPVCGLGAFTDTERPVMFAETEEEKPLDEEEGE